MMTPETLIQFNDFIVRLQRQGRCDEWMLIHAAAETWLAL